MRSIRTTIAVGVTLTALGGLTAVALSAGASEPVGPSVPSPTAEVRTEVLEEVVHRTRRAPEAAVASARVAVGSPARPRLPAVAAAAPGTGTSGVGDRGRNRGSDDHGRGGDDDHGDDLGGNDD